MSLPKNKAWFPLKTYGYGWGFPKKWQGWVILFLYLLTIGIGVIWLSSKHTWLFVLFSFIATVILMAILFWKGESPKWRL